MKIIACLSLLFLFAACGSPKDDRVWYAYEVGTTTTTAGKIVFKGDGYFEMSVVESPNGSTDPKLQTFRCGTYFGGENWSSVDTTEGEVIDIRTKPQFYFKPDGSNAPILFDKNSSNKDSAESLIQPVWNGC